MGSGTEPGVGEKLPEAIGVAGEVMARLGRTDTRVDANKQHANAGFDSIAKPHRAPFSKNALRLRGSLNEVRPPLSLIHRHWRKKGSDPLSQNTRGARTTASGFRTATSIVFGGISVFGRA